MLTAKQMCSPPDCFKNIPIPDAQGRRHRLPVVLAIAAGAILCGMRGYSAIAQWANALGPKARARFGCRRVKGVYRVPSTFVIRDCLVRIEAGALDRALAAWNQTWGGTDQGISIDGKTMKNAIDEDGNQTHILSAIGHETATCFAQKVDSLPIVGSDEVKRTNEIGMAIPLLANCALAGKDDTADAPLTQRSIATDIVEQKGHYHFTVKGNQPTLEEDIALIFAQRGAADFVEITPPDHGRIRLGASGALRRSMTTSIFLTGPSLYDRA
ncbi:MAG: ISAs1 family transposase [Rhodoferax sp.]|nr:ISAs1 family transposase [Rhodoferax sp.]